MIMESNEEVDIFNITQRRCNSSNNDRCAINSCNSVANKNLNLSFHRFPAANERFLYSLGNAGHVEKTDIREVWRSATGIQNITLRTKICSLHFLKSDYIVKGSHTSRKRVLKKSAVPSCGLDKKKLTQIKNTCTTKNVQDKHVQVNTDSFLPRCLKSETDLMIATGIESFKVLNNIAREVGKASQDKYRPNDVIMSPLNRVTMTYVKLKQNLDYNFLAILFNCYSAGHCRQIFHGTLLVLSKCLTASIKWPSKEDEPKDIPDLPEDLKNVTVILDCIQIYIEGFDNPYKVIIGSSLAGFITFISEPQNAHDADSVIFQQCNITNLLKPGDVVMVGSDFSIDEVCILNGFKCIRPQSKIQMKYLNRFYQKLKSYNLINSIIPEKVVPIIKDIFIVICSIINMSLSIQD